MATTTRRSTATSSSFHRNNKTMTSHSPSSSFASATNYYTSSPSTGFFNQRRSVSPSRVNQSTDPFPRAVPSRRLRYVPKLFLERGIHPGSFRCAMHKNNGVPSAGHYTPNRLNMRRSAMTNSLVRIGTVEGDLVRRALSALIRPSSHQQRRRGEFRPRPSRLSNMSKV